MTLQNILKRNTYKNVIILFTGSSIAQIIPILATLILTRIFTKEQFGIFFIYSSLCMVLSTFITLKLELSILLPKNMNESFSLFISSILASLILSFFIFIGIFIFYSQISSLLGNKNIDQLLYYVPISLFFLGVIQSCTYWFNRNNKFKSISVVNITKSVTSSTIQLILGILSFLKYGLIAGLISGQFISALYSLYFSFKTKVVDAESFTFKKMFNLINKYKSIPIFNTSIGVTNTLSNQLPIFLLTGFYSLEMAALYGLASRIVATPMGLIGQSIGPVLFNEASKKHNNNESLKGLVRSTYKKLFKIAIIPFIIIGIAAPFIFRILFGAEWEMAGTFTQLLIPWLFLMFLNSPMSYIIIILDKQKYMLIYDILLLIFRFFGLYIGYKFLNSVYYSIALFSFVGVAFNLFYFFYIIRISKKSIIDGTT
ncbi:MAG: hypothetical protein A2041_07590 [Bacteroidetes bacterium GWA2_31_9b]|nr:MAG: hypothetical protein A2041_07590 [Bacteroidetes bacterium GWA2_31_9b]